ncbi:MAG: lysylphosphatidylglycerol synthase transmembrane domain-containing protein, partial [Candidatus Omnitrophota bacterium]
RIPFGRVIQLSFIGFFFNNFMPTAVGGDIVKAYYANKQTKETAKSFISVFMDRFIGVISFVLLAVFALFLSWANINEMLKKTVLIFALAGTAGLFVILNPAPAKVIFNVLSRLKLWNIGGRLTRAYMAVHEYRKKKALIFAVIGVSLISQSIYFTVVYLLAKSLGANLLLVTVFLVMPIVSLVSMLPSLGGLGLRESALLVLLGPVIGSDNAFSVSILLLATLLILSLIGAAIYVSAAQFRIGRADIAKLEPYSV